jgi:hypothetical protein
MLDDEEEYISDDELIDANELKLRNRCYQIPYMAYRIWENVIKNYQQGNCPHWNPKLLVNCSPADIENFLYIVFEKKHGDINRYM